MWAGPGPTRDRFGSRIGSISGSNRGRSAVESRSKSLRNRFGLDMASTWGRFGTDSGSNRGRIRSGPTCRTRSGTLAISTPERIHTQALLLALGGHCALRLAVLCWRCSRGAAWSPHRARVRLSARPAVHRRCRMPARRSCRPARKSCGPWTTSSFAAIRSSPTPWSRAAGGLAACADLACDKHCTLACIFGGDRLLAIRLRLLLAATCCLPTTGHLRWVA